MQSASNLPHIDCTLNQVERGKFRMSLRLESWCGGGLILPYADVLKRQTPFHSLKSANLWDSSQILANVYSCTCMNLCLYVQEIDPDTQTSVQTKVEALSRLRATTNSALKSSFNWSSMPPYMLKVVRPLSYGVKYEHLATILALTVTDAHAAILPSMHSPPSPIAGPMGMPVDSSNRKEPWTALQCGCCKDLVAVANSETAVAVLPPHIRPYSEVLVDAAQPKFASRYFPELGILLPRRFLEFENAKTQQPEVQNRIVELLQNTRIALMLDRMPSDLIATLGNMLDTLQAKLLPLINPTTTAADSEVMKSTFPTAHSVVRTEIINSMLASLAQPIAQGLMRSHRLALAVNFLAARPYPSSTLSDYDYDEAKSQSHSPNSSLLSSSVLSPLQVHRVISDELQAVGSTSAATTYNSSHATRLFPERRSGGSEHGISPNVPLQRSLLPNLDVSAQATKSDISQPGEETDGTDPVDTESDGEFQDVFGVFGMDGEQLAQSKPTKTAAQTHRRKFKSISKMTIETREIGSDNEYDPLADEKLYMAASNASRPALIASQPVTKPSGAHGDDVHDRHAIALSMARSVAIPISSVLNQATSRAATSNRSTEEVSSTVLPEPKSATEATQDSGSHHSAVDKTTSIIAPGSQTKPLSRMNSMPPPDLNASKSLSGSSITEDLLDGTGEDDALLRAGQSILTTTHSADGFQEPDPMGTLSDLTGSEVEGAMVMTTGADTNDPDLYQDTTKTSVIHHKRNALSARITSTVVTRIVPGVTTGSDASGLVASLNSTVDASILTGSGTPLITDLEAVTDESFDPTQLLDPVGRGRERSSTRTSLDHRRSRGSVTTDGNTTMQNLQPLALQQANPAFVHSANSPSSPFSALAAATSPTHSGLDTVSSASASTLSMPASKSVRDQISHYNPRTQSAHYPSSRAARASHTNLSDDESEDDVHNGTPDESIGQVPHEDDDLVRGLLNFEDPVLAYDNDDDDDDDHDANEDLDESGSEPDFNYSATHHETSFDEYDLYANRAWRSSEASKELDDDEYVDELANRLGARGMTPPIASATEAQHTSFQETPEAHRIPKAWINTMDTNRGRPTQELAPSALGIGAELGASPPHGEASEDIAIARTLLMHGASMLAVMLPKSAKQQPQLDDSQANSLEFEFADVPTRGRDPTKPSSLMRAISVADVLQRRNSGSSSQPQSQPITMRTTSAPPSAVPPYAAESSGSSSLHSQPPLQVPLSTLSRGNLSRTSMVMDPLPEAETDE